MPPPKSTVCVTEDRKACEPCLKLLLASLDLHSHGIPVSLFYPVADENFRRWLSAYPQVQLQSDRLKDDYGWNVKPQAIMGLLDAGFDEVIWIDSDVLVTRDIRRLFDGLDSAVFVAAEHTLAPERHDGNGLRAQLWQLPVGRVFPTALNSGVLRATKQHYGLMRRWWELLQTDAYQECQQNERVWQKRPIHMLGDQDVLTALLTSVGFADIPLKLLRRGKHIIQFDGVWGYTTAERMRNLLGDGPTFIHSPGGKPWIARWDSETSNQAREYIKMLYLDVSPYTLSSIRFRQELGCDTSWMSAHYRLSSILRCLTMQNSILAGLPMAVFADIARLIKRGHEMLFRRSWIPSLEFPSPASEAQKTLSESRQ